MLDAHIRALVMAATRLLEALTLLVEDELEARNS